MEKDLKERLRCFCPHEDVRVEGNDTGPLSGLSFAAKDLFYVKGFRTSGGCPDWLNTHELAESTAPVILHLLDAGAHLVGKTMTDDLACGMFGENAHYGTPLNPTYPERVPGGSSSGSASAVAGGAVDFALGTDTGGSVRVPAAYCGIFGIRPSHGVINLTGCIPMAPYFDTCGWFARSASLLRTIGEVLLPHGEVFPPGEICVAEDVLAYVDDDIREGFESGLVRLGLANAKRVNVFNQEPQHYVDTFWPIMSRQLWNTHGVWFERETPTLAPGLAERLRKASEVTAQQFWNGVEARQAIQQFLSHCLREQRVVVMPTTHQFAPLLKSPQDELDAYRLRAVALTGVASLGGLPQVSMPGLEKNGLPIGFSLLGAPGSDRMLLKLVEEWSGQF